MSTAQVNVGIELQVEWVDFLPICYVHANVRLEPDALLSVIDSIPGVAYVSVSRYSLDFTVGKLFDKEAVGAAALAAIRRVLGVNPGLAPN